MQSSRSRGPPSPRLGREARPCHQTRRCLLPRLPPSVSSRLCGCARVRVVRIYRHRALASAQQPTAREVEAVGGGGGERRRR